MSAFRQRIIRIVVAVGLSGMMVGCGARTPVEPAGPSPPANAVPILGPACLSGAQLVAWFQGRQPRPPGTFAATVPVEILAQYYIDEGGAEGVTGDIAFIQSIVETGWFRFNGLVPAAANNFSGIGATDSNPGPATFSDARTGVRAQIQHLRAYADAGALTCTAPPLHNPCVDPRFDLVVPKGKAPTWNQLGNGNWAAASTYGNTILLLYDEALTFNATR